MKPIQCISEILSGTLAILSVEEQKRLLLIGGRRDEYDGSPLATISVQDFGIHFVYFYCRSAEDRWIGAATRTVETRSRAIRHLTSTEGANLKTGEADGQEPQLR